MKFKKFLETLSEDDVIDYISEIQKVISLMDPEDLDDFSNWLVAEINGEYDDFETLTKDEIMEIITSLSDEDLEYVYDMVQTDDDFDHADINIEKPDDKEEVYEGVSRRLTKKKANKKKNLKFKKTAAQLRAGLAARKKENRLNKAKRKKYQRKNKVSLRKYAKSRASLIKKGAHVVKKRIGAKPSK